MSDKTRIKSEQQERVSTTFPCFILRLCSQVACDVGRSEINPLIREQVEFYPPLRRIFYDVPCLRSRREEPQMMAGGVAAFSLPSFLIFLSSLLLLLISVSASRPSSHVDDDDAGALSLRSTYPYGEAEKLIRRLNLFPGTQLLEREWRDGFRRSPPLVERKFKFPNIADPVSVEDLGHHAGYYHLPHTHGAR